MECKATSRRCERASGPVSTATLRSSDTGPAPARMFPAGPARFAVHYRFAAVQAAESAKVCAQLCSWPCLPCHFGYRNHQACLLAVGWVVAAAPT